MGAPLVVGLFVGGLASRFGGIAKGNLRHPSGVRLIERLVSVCQSALPDAPVVLVGERAEYDDLGLSSLRDDPSGIGPLGGLRALVSFGKKNAHDAVIALACDMPFVTGELVSRLALENPVAAALAPRADGRWEPLAARYAASILPVLDAAIAAGEHSLQRIFARLGDGACALSIEEKFTLVDWDCPEDVSPRSPASTTEPLRAPYSRETLARPA
jgi:molybdopterin-guanine dinucleotide biosynthesis protein A